MGYSSMAERRTLNPCIFVRIQVSQLKYVIPGFMSRGLVFKKGVLYEYAAASSGSRKTEKTG